MQLSIPPQLQPPTAIAQLPIRGWQALAAIELHLAAHLAYYFDDPLLLAHLAEVDGLPVAGQEHVDMIRAVYACWHLVVLVPLGHVEVVLQQVG